MEHVQIQSKGFPTGVEVAFDNSLPFKFMIMLMKVGRIEPPKSFKTSDKPFECPGCEDCLF